MPTAPRPTYPITNITPSSGGGDGGPLPTHTYVTIGGIDGDADRDGTAQALATRLEIASNTDFLFIQGNGSNTGSGVYRMVSGTAVAQSAPLNGSTVSVLHFYLNDSIESSGYVEARRVSGFWTVVQGYDFQPTALRMVAPRLLEVSGNSVVAEITRDAQGVLSHNTLALLPYDPEAEGDLGSKIKLPAPAGTGQRIVAFAADGTYSEYPGETVWWEEEPVSPGTYSSVSLNSLFGLSYPVTATTTITFAFTGDDPDAVVVLDDTYADFAALATDIGTQLGAALPADWTVGGVPDTDPLIVGIYRETIGVGQNISVTAATGGDPIGALTWDITDGHDPGPDLDADPITRGVAGGGEGLLGAPGNDDFSLGGTHTSPGSLNAYRKGWVIVDGDGQWSVEKWPDRISLNHGGWVSNVGPFGAPENVYHMSAVIEYLKAWMNPAAGEGHLIRDDDAQVVGGVFDEQHRWLVATTDDADADVTYTLAAASDAKKYTLNFTRRSGDNAAHDFIVTDGAGFTVTLAPGEFCTVQSAHTDYVNGSLSSGTGDGELDHPDNQVYGWVRR